MSQIKKGNLSQIMPPPVPATREKFTVPPGMSCEPKRPLACHEECQRRGKEAENECEQKIAEFIKKMKEMGCPVAGCGLGKIVGCPVKKKRKAAPQGNGLLKTKTIWPTT